MISSLPPDLILKILSYLISKPIRTCPLTATNLRHLLPFALTNRYHYNLTISSIHALYFLPIDTDNPSIPPYPHILTRNTSFPTRKPSTIPIHHLYAALNSLPHLRILRISLAVPITDQALLCLTPLLQNLRQLSIPGNHAISIRGLKTLTQCKRLQHLDLSYCFNLSDDCAAYIRQMLQLTHLQIAYWRVTDCFVGVISTLPNLQHLSLSTCAAITSKSCHYLGSHASKLTSLKLNACVNLDDTAISSLSACTYLQFLDLSMVRGITDAAALSLGDPLLFPRLHTLLLSQCSQLSDLAVHYLSRNSNITCLDFSFCYSLTSNISHSLPSFSNLLKLDLTSCPRISDHTVGIAVQLPNLRSLKLANCTALTHMAARYISANPNLEHVDVRGCPFPSHLLSAIRHHCGELCV